MHTLGDALLDSLATYRLTRLITMDEITARPRDEIVRRLEEAGHSKLAYLVQCPHCVGVWVGFGVVVVAPHLLGRAWPAARAALSASALTSIVASFEGAAHD